VQAEGPTGVLGITLNSNGAGVAGIGRFPAATGVFGSGGSTAVWGTAHAPVLLWVATRKRGGFTVAAAALPGHKMPKGGVGFSWRVMARRADLARAKRFADVKLPELAALPDLPEAMPKPAHAHAASKTVRVPVRKENALGQRLATPADLARMGQEASGKK